MYFDAEEGPFDKPAPVSSSVGDGPSETAAGQGTREAEALAAIRQHFAEVDLPDATYCRFLRARDWDTHKATQVRLVSLHHDEVTRR